MGNFQNPLAKKEGLVIQEMPDEVLVYNTKTYKAHCLNRTAAFVWGSCNGKNSASDIAALMALEFNADIPEDLIWMAINKLRKDELLDEVSSVEIKNISRREVMRKIGIVSIVALPVIASIVAPTSALAGAGSACACINPPSCATQPACPSLTNCNGSGVCAP